MDRVPRSPTVSPTPPHVAVMAYVGLVGVGCFVVSTFALLAVRPEGSSIHEPVSYYVHGHHGWILTMGLLALGLGSLALSVAAMDRVQSHTGPRGLAVFGLAAIATGFFPADPAWPWEHSPSLNAAVHGASTLIALVAFATTAIPLMRALRKEAGWVRITPFFYVTVAAGVLGLVGAFVSKFAGLPPQFLGLSERVAIGAGVAWLGLVGCGLVRGSLFAGRGN